MFSLHLLHFHNNGHVILREIVSKKQETVQGVAS